MASTESLPRSLIERVGRGEAVVYPTSTLPALGCRPEARALDLIYDLKGRDPSQPVSIAVADLNQASELVVIPEGTSQLLASFHEGSLTLVLPARSSVDSRLGGDSIAVRVVAHPTAKQLLREVGPLTATSANRSGEAPSADCREAAEALGLPEDAALPEVCPGGQPSTLIRTYGHGPLTYGTALEVLREGIVSKSEVMSWSMRTL